MVVHQPGFEKGNKIITNVVDMIDQALAEFEINKTPSPETIVSAIGSVSIDQRPDVVPHSVAA